eukprot:SAG31_NODE_6560_length_1974_cov_2.083733_3_plen_118_part_00
MLLGLLIGTLSTTAMTANNTAIEIGGPPSAVAAITATYPAVTMALSLLFRCASCDRSVLTRLRCSMPGSWDMSRTALRGGRLIACMSKRRLEKMSVTKLLGIGLAVASGFAFSRATD